MTKHKHRRQWRHYETAAGRAPVREFIDSLSDEDAADVFAGMKEVREEGLVNARHLRGDIYEVRVDGLNQAYRILFSAEGRFNHVLLGLNAFSKKTQRTPPREIALAEDRLADWRARARPKTKR